MKVELRKFKHSPSLSEETEAFTAELFFDGRKVGTASNHGTGGPNDAHINSPEDRKAFAAFVATLPPEPNPYDPESPFKVTEDFFIGGLVEKLLEAKEEAKAVKRMEKLAAKARLAGQVALSVKFDGFIVEATCAPANVAAMAERINQKHGKGQQGIVKVYQ